MNITLTQLDAIAGRRVDRANAGSFLAGIAAFPAIGFDKPPRAAHYVAQMLHESMGFTFDVEVWGPTPAQKRYEGRADLGNTQPGDGYRFRGRTGIMLTGRDGYRNLRDWCRAHVSSKAPDFEAQPDLVLTDPWEGIAPVWYWTTRRLNDLADKPGDQVEAITRKINGGVNGLADRQRYYTRAALEMLGYGVEEVRAFQTAAGLAVDGIAGRDTRSALAGALADLPRAANTADDRIAALEARVAALEARAV